MKKSIEELIERARSAWLKRLRRDGQEIPERFEIRRTGKKILITNGSELLAGYRISLGDSVEFIRPLQSSSMSKTEIREFLHIRQRGKCYECGGAIEDESVCDIRRIVPRPQGGDYCLPNLALAHATCRRTNQLNQHN